MILLLIIQDSEASSSSGGAYPRGPQSEGGMFPNVTGPLDFENEKHPFANVKNWGDTTQYHGMENDFPSWTGFQHQHQKKRKRSTDTYGDIGIVSSSELPGNNNSTRRNLPTTDDNIRIGTGSYSSSSDADSDKTPTQATVAQAEQKNKDKHASAQAADQLRAYLLGNFENGQFTDSRIVLRSFSDNFPPVYFKTHNLIIARSPMISCIQQMHKYSRAASNIGTTENLASTNESSSNFNSILEINATAGHNFSSVKAFEAALWCLYGLPVLNQTSLKRMASSSSTVGYHNDDDQEDEDEGSAEVKNKKAYVHSAACYASSGAFFGDNQIVEEGATMIFNAIDLDTVQLVFHFGLEVDGFLVACFDGHNNLHPAHQQQQAVVNNLRQTWATHIVSASLGFICNLIGPYFSLHKTAKVSISSLDRTSIAQRLYNHYASGNRTGNIYFTAAEPDTDTDSGTEISTGTGRALNGSWDLFPSIIANKPDLVKIKFGSMPNAYVDTPGPPRDATVGRYIASALLVSLPYELLKEMFTILDSRDAVMPDAQHDNRLILLARQVIGEREKRRRHALRSWAAVADRYTDENGRDNISPEMWEMWELGYREFVVPTESAGVEIKDGVRIIIGREWKGLGR